jgi:hypothetical protein
MKRIEGGRIMSGDFGVVRDAGPPIAIYSHGGGGKSVWVYDTIDDLIAAGWAVD